MFSGVLTLFSCLWLIYLSGCASISKGVIEGLVSEKENEVDTRRCEIQGPAITGISEYFKDANLTNIKRSHVLMVYGIGTPTPGYSTRLSENLVGSLNLTSIDAEIKKSHLKAQYILMRLLGN